MSAERKSIPEFGAWFETVTGRGPHPWQRELGGSDVCGDRAIRIPTGFGKTAGTVLAWAYHRLVRRDPRWPLRLVFCLPMRTLVEQTERAVQRWLKAMKSECGVHVLMGGTDAGDWHLHPERPAILLGTQDMLLSRALNRGFGANRPRWPMEFGLLHTDALWVFDEVQLMDVGLTTSVQLAAFRDLVKERQTTGRPARSWWMSATLRPRWFKTVDFRERAEVLEADLLQIPRTHRKGDLWKIKKELLLDASTDSPEAIAARTLEHHLPGTLSLAVVNTVDRAIAVFEELAKAGRPARGKGKKNAEPPSLQVPELRLIHSRFRGLERRAWPDSVLTREGIPEAGRIIISTQVVEAGVDLSAALLVTELAPWSSLVQRFGRVARYAKEKGRVVVVGKPQDEKRARPYDLAQLSAAARALKRLAQEPGDASISGLAAFEDSLEEEEPGLLEALYAFRPQHVLRQPDLWELFDTSPDLSGADLDVSRFIRVGEERNVQLFWRDVEARAAEIHRDAVGSVLREELCPVPVGQLEEWRADPARSVWRLDYLDGVWRRLRRAERVHPGQTLLLSAADGGYDPARGWAPRSRLAVPVVSPPPAEGEAAHERQAEESEDDESLSAVTSPSAWQRIADHGADVAAQVQTIARRLGLPEPLAQHLTLAARWHDAGKVHPAFQDAIKRDDAVPMSEHRDLAKAPDKVWRRPPYDRDRRGFRHELASTLSLFELLRRADPDHPALLGDLREVLSASGVSSIPVDAAERVPADDALARELLGLDATGFDRVAWLICTHHGKVRCTWASTPHDQEAGLGGIHGVREEPLPGLELATESGARAAVPALHLHLDGAGMGLNGRYGLSWSERARRLLEHHGPFELAYLEALLRSADVRASRALSEEGR